MALRQSSAGLIPPVLQSPEPSTQRRARAARSRQPMLCTPSRCRQPPHSCPCPRAGVAGKRSHGCASVAGTRESGGPGGPSANVRRGGAGNPERTRRPQQKMLPGVAKHPRQPAMAGPPRRGGAPVTLRPADRPAAFPRRQRRPWFQEPAPTFGRQTASAGRRHRCRRPPGRSSRRRGD